MRGWLSASGIDPFAPDDFPAPEERDGLDLIRMDPLFGPFHLREQANSTPTGTTDIPEPGSVFLLGAGVLVLAGRFCPRS